MSLSLDSFMSGQILPEDPVATINGVEIYSCSSWQECNKYKNIQPRRLRFIYIRDAKKALDQQVDRERKYPGLYPSNEFNMAILQGVYAKIYALYQEELQGQGSPVLLGGRNDINTLKTYESILKELTVTSYDLYSVIHEINILNSPPEIDEIMNEIREAYRQEGFADYTNYFGGWVNLDNIYIKAKKGEIPLRPNTFEAGSLLKPEKYREVLTSLTQHGRGYGCDMGEEKLYMGWKKADLKEAIKNSGLLRTPPADDPTKYRRENYVKGRWPTNPDGSPDRRILLWRDIGIDRRGSVPGVVGKGMDYPLCYYLVLYKKIFETHDYIDWAYLCGKRLVDYHTLKFIAHRDYKMDYNRVKKLKYNQICQEINKIALERNELSAVVAQSLADVAAITAPQVILQPTSPWIKAPTRSQFIEGQNKTTQPYEIYQALTGACQDNGVSKDQLIQLTNNLGIRWLLPRDVPSAEDPNIVRSGLEPYSKEQICQYLLERYKNEAEKYEYVSFDCRNAAVTKRFIVNAAANMGLGGVIPKDISSLTKEQLCDIMNKYINILRSTKALTGN